MKLNDAQTNSQAWNKHIPLYCDSITFFNLIQPHDWTNLPKEYSYRKCDSVVGPAKIKINACMVRYGKTVAYGNLDKKNQPAGWWGVLSNSENPSPGEILCCQGKIKKGKKEKRWYALDGYVLNYSKNQKLRISHNRWADN